MLAIQASFTLIERLATDLGFEFCAYFLRSPIPFTRPKTVMLTNYPVQWRDRYTRDFLDRDPSIKRGFRTIDPTVWSPDLFQDVPELLTEASLHGIRHGWVQSVHDGNGLIGVMTLARSSGAIGPTELAMHEPSMRRLVQTAHHSLASGLAARLGLQQECALSNREVEALRWTADGKTASEIASILELSEHTVGFHLKNASSKLGCPNKTAAVARAAILGYLR